MAAVAATYVVIADQRLLASLGKPRRQRRVDAMLAQAITEQPGELRIVFHDQHPHDAKIGAPPLPVIPGSGAGAGRFVER